MLIYYFFEFEIDYFFQLVIQEFNYQVICEEKNNLKPTEMFRYKGEVLPVLSSGAGKHQIANGMAIVLAMLSLGVDFSVAVLKIARPVYVSGRLERLVTKNGALLINDCYNASPTSVEAAIDVLAMQPVDKTWLILGALGELGEQQNSCLLYTSPSPRDRG